MRLHFITKRKPLTIYQTTAVALMTAVLCILAPMTIPIGPIPISMTNFVIFITIYLLGTRLSLFSYLIYLLVGFAGLPVFSGYSGGPAKLAGPTGGYLVGFFFLLFIAGYFITQTKRSVFGMVLGTLVAYFFGTIWFILQTKCTFFSALSICVFPFLPADAIKILLAAKIGPLLCRTLKRARLLDKL